MLYSLHVEWQDELVEPDEPDVLYRAWASSEGDYIYCTEYKIITRTKKGAWISSWGENYIEGDPKRFVLLTAKKQWASETKAEAVRQLYHRMKKWSKYLIRDLNRANACVELIEAEKLI